MSGGLPRVVRGGKTLPPFRVGSFVFTPTGVEVEGKPEFNDYYAAWDFATRANASSGFWLADLLRYGATRSEWATMLSQVQDATGLSEKTLKNVRAVGAIPPSRRKEGVGFQQHETVAGLEPDEQEHWLDVAKTEGLNVQDLRRAIRASKRTRIIEGQAVLKGLYGVILADPPWSYRDSGATEDGSLAKAEGSYPTMSIADIAKLPVAAHALPDSVLFLYVTASHLYENPGPREVMEAWGFTYKTNIVWNKVIGMPGHYGFQVIHEHLIIATRGNGLPDVDAPHDLSVQTIRRHGEHSSKPGEIRKVIEKHWTRGPYLELFARQKTEGWDSFGHDARLWT